MGARTRGRKGGIQATECKETWLSGAGLHLNHAESRAPLPLCLGTNPPHPVPSSGPGELNSVRTMQKGVNPDIGS